MSVVRVTEAVRLDEKGRCCGRKPIRYKRDHPPTKAPFMFCDRCRRAFGMDGKQVTNWAYKVEEPRHA